jgi:hypothetical protein
MMTRTTTTLISVLAASAMTLALSSVAIASEYSSVSAIVGPSTQGEAEPGGYSSPVALVGGDEASEVGSVTDSVSAIAGPANVTSPPATQTSATTSSDAFDWADALIGAAVSLGLALTTAMAVGVMRRRTRVEPSF